jgi:hypothetical protein
MIEMTVASKRMMYSGLFHGLGFSSDGESGLDNGFIPILFVWLVPDRMFTLKVLFSYHKRLENKVYFPGGR